MILINVKLYTLTKKTHHIGVKTMKNKVGSFITLSLLAIMFSISANAQTVGEYDFTLQDVSYYCEVYKYHDSYGEIECNRRKLRPVERSCEVYFYDQEYGELECIGSEFRLLERRCTVYLYSEEYGEISC